MLRIVLAALLAAVLADDAQAANHDRGHGHGHGAAAPAAASDVVTGEVRRVDNEAGKVTIRHEPLPNLDMPAMTMVFQVGDRALLDKVKVGDKVRFETQKICGQFTVTQIERVP